MQCFIWTTMQLIAPWCVQMALHLQPRGWSMSLWNLRSCCICCLGSIVCRLAVILPMMPPVSLLMYHGSNKPIKNRWSCRRTWVSGVFARVLRQQVTGKHNPVKAVQCLLPLWWRKNKSCIPGSKHSTCRLCPDFASNQTAKKGKRASHHLSCACYHFICRIEILHLCSSDSCAQWQRLIYVSVCECVLVSGVWIIFNIIYLILV